MPKAPVRMSKARRRRLDKSYRERVERLIGVMERVWQETRPQFEEWLLSQPGADLPPIIPKVKRFVEEEASAEHASSRPDAAGRGEQAKEEEVARPLRPSSVYATESTGEEDAGNAKTQPEVVVSEFSLDRNGEVRAWSGRDGQGYIETEEYLMG